MDDKALNILTIVVLVPLFVVASVGGFFLIGARQTWRGGLASFLSFSTAVAIPLFAFRWRSGVPFPEALGFAVVASPLMVAGFILALIARSAVMYPASFAEDVRDFLRRRDVDEPSRKGPTDVDGPRSPPPG